MTVDSRWGHWDFSLTQSFRPHYGPEVDLASNRNDYQGYLLGVKAAGAYVSEPCHLEILGASNSWSPYGLSRHVKGQLYLFIHSSGGLFVILAGFMREISEGR
jgi:hypothetical protein